MVALIGQKFVTDIASDAMHYSRLRQQSSTSQSTTSTKKFTLIMEDLTSALSDYGVNIKRPNYYT
jgi:transcription initiation factor TFIID subunit 10